MFLISSPSHIHFTCLNHLTDIAFSSANTSWLTTYESFISWPATLFQGLPPEIGSSLPDREWLHRLLHTHYGLFSWTTSGTSGYRLDSPENRYELDWKVQKFMGRNSCKRKGMETSLGRISVRPQCRCDKSLPAQRELRSGAARGVLHMVRPFHHLPMWPQARAASGKHELSHPALLSHWPEASPRKGWLWLKCWSRSWKS